MNSIYEDADNNIWVTFWRKGIFRYDRVKDTFVKYPAVGKENNPFCVFQDDKKQHWIGTWGEGLYKFYPEEKKSKFIYQLKVLGMVNYRKMGHFSAFSRMIDMDIFG
ncbi:hypothetical protein SFC43_34245 [Bacteroides sp. CR5/BHMF/2]|nr:hypothetical protein [Bacteroides sp. CR5/BHMF/2]